MPPFQYLEGNNDARSAIGQMSSDVNSIAYALPRLRMQAEAMRQRAILQNAERILREAQAKEALAQGAHYNAQTDYTKAKTAESQGQQQRLGMVEDSVRNMENVGVDPRTNPGTYRTGMAPMMGATAYLQAAKDPTGIGQALAALQQFQSADRNDPLAMASMAFGRPLPMGSSVGMDAHAPIEIPQGGMVIGPDNNVMATGQPRVPSVGSPGTALASQAWKLLSDPVAKGQLNPEALITLWNIATNSPAVRSAMPTNGPASSLPVGPINDEPIRANTDQEYNALTKGTRYMDRNGNIGIKR